MDTNYSNSLYYYQTKYCCNYITVIIIKLIYIMPQCSLIDLLLLIMFKTNQTIGTYETNDTSTKKQND